MLARSFRQATAIGSRRSCATATQRNLPPKSPYCVPRSQLKDPNNILPWPGTDRFRELAAAANLRQAAETQAKEAARSPSKTTSFESGGGNFSGGNVGSGTDRQSYPGSQQQQSFQQETAQPKKGLNGLNGHAHAEPAPKALPQFVQYVTDYGVPYYHNPDTNETVWELPAGAAAVCSQSGEPIAVNTTSNSAQVQTEAAKTIEKMAKEVEDEKKMQQKFAEAAQRVEPVDPAALGEIQVKSGWERYDTEDGRPYYYHRPTGVTQWEKPV